MTVLDTRPQVIDIDHYGGDTLILHLAAPVEVIGSRVFSAQVRSKRGSTRLDAQFVVVTTPTGADIMLLSADCKRLSKRGLYSGFWDVQLAMAGDVDPVTTLAHGEMRIHPDVTGIQP